MAVLLKPVQKKWYNEKWCEEPIASGIPWKTGCTKHRIKHHSQILSGSSLWNYLHHRTIFYLEPQSFCFPVPDVLRVKFISKRKYQFFQDRIFPYVFSIQYSNSGLNFEGCEHLGRHCPRKRWQSHFLVQLVLLIDKIEQTNVDPDFSLNLKTPLGLIIGDYCLCRSSFRQEYFKSGWNWAVHCKFKRENLRNLKEVRGTMFWNIVVNQVPLFFITDGQM